MHPPGATPPRPLLAVKSPNVLVDLNWRGRLVGAREVYSRT